MKKILFLIILVTLISGYFYYTYTSSYPNTIEPIPVQVDTTFETLDPKTATDSAQISVFENSEFGFNFKYRIKPSGYSLFENSPVQNIEQGTLFGVTLVRSDDYNETVRAAAEGNAYDGPPSMSVSIFDAPNVTDVALWLTQNKMVTNCEPGSVSATVLAGRDASSCLWDGLYLGVTVALLHDNKIYLLTGTREEGETVDGFSYKKDLDELVGSFGVAK
jgi:hypothetical protein